MSKTLADGVVRATGGTCGNGAASAERHVAQVDQDRPVPAETNTITADDYGKLLLRLAVGGLACS